MNTALRPHHTPRHTRLAAAVAAAAVVLGVASKADTAAGPRAVRKEEAGTTAVAAHHTQVHHLAVHHSPAAAGHRRADLVAAVEEGKTAGHNFAAVVVVDHTDCHQRSLTVDHIVVVVVADAVDIHRCSPASAGHMVAAADHGFVVAHSSVDHTPAVPDPQNHTAQEPDSHQNAAAAAGYHKVPDSAHAVQQADKLRLAA